MFTPPPSPDPRRKLSTPHASNPSLTLDVAHDLFHSPSSSRTRTPSPESPRLRAYETPLSPKEDPYAHALSEKKRIGRRTRWTVMLVPLLLAIVGLSTRYLAHPAAFDALSSRTPEWSAVGDWTPHKRHASPDPQPASSPATTVPNTTPTGSSLSLASSATAAPTQTVSANSTKVPWTTPVLPTPFPQPFDSTTTTNFSTVACENFMTNMTQTAPFRQCRPFSLLVEDSDDFITQSQRNITELNIIIWGTCNTDLSAEQCTSNMAWFGTSIQTQCKQDITANNPIVMHAVAGLQAYAVMRKAACQVNAQTDTYCYVEAAQSASPSDLYLYHLPLGLALPNATAPSCTPCVQSLMGAYAADGGNVTKLRETYAPAADVVNGACGGSFVAAVEAGGGRSGNGALAPVRGGGGLLTAGVAVAVLMVSLY